MMKILNITGTEVQKAYENVQMFDDMPDKFKDAWAEATSYLPSSWASDAIQFAEEGNQILVIATVMTPVVTRHLQTVTL